MTNLIPLDEADFYKRCKPRALHLLSSSAAARKELGAVREGARKPWFVDADKLSDFIYDDWVYIGALREWQHKPTRPMITTREAAQLIGICGSRFLNIVKRSQAARDALGALQYPSEKRWWVRREKLLTLDDRFWPSKPPRTFDPVIPWDQRPHVQSGRPEMQPGQLTLRQAARLIGWSPLRLRNYLLAPGNAEKLGAVKTPKTEWWLVDEQKLLATLGGTKPERLPPDLA